MQKTQEFYDNVSTLIRVACKTLKKLPYRSAEYDELSEAIADVEEYMENDDPIQNGWVNSRGEP